MEIKVCINFFLPVCLGFHNPNMSLNIIAKFLKIMKMQQFNSFEKVNL